jgi:hypothetical protein
MIYTGRKNSYKYQCKLIEFLKTKFETVNKIYYFSNGAASQYKNKKNFINLCNHFNDFGIHAEWHFFATSHGKGPCDGVGGSIKRNAARASLQLAVKDHITTPKHLFEYSKKMSKQMNFEYFEQCQYVETEDFLKQRFNSAKRLPETQKMHAIIPLDNFQVIAKYVSFSDVSKICRVSR